MPSLSGVFDRVRRRGLIGAVKRAAHRLLWQWEEMRLGVKTAGDIPADQLGHGEQQFGYQPIDPRSLRAALDLLRPNAADVFVDMGCGMGRGVLVAARYPFSRVLGVEYSKPLFVAAHRNANRAAKKLGRKLQVVQADATQWDFPDDVTVVFLFNPFQGEMLQRMLANLRRSIDRAPREVHIVYSLPKTDRDLLAECDWLRVRHQVETDNADWERMTIYRAAAIHRAGTGRGRS